MPRRNIWEQLWESTEGPTVTLNLPRAVAEELLNMIAGALDMEGGEDGLGMDDDMGDDSMDDLDAGGPPGFGEDEPGDDMFGGDGPDFGADDDDETPAGDDDGGDDGRPKAKAAKKPADGKPKKKDKSKDDDDGDKPTESLGESVRRLGAYVPRGRR